MPNFFQNLASKPLMQGAMNTAKTLGSHIGGGLTLGVAGAATAGVGMAANKAYEALTLGRDFRAMMSDPFNKDLHEYHQRDPAVFNAAFNGLRKANHEMSANPMTAGSYMRRMMEFSPDQAGGILLEARNHRVDELNPLQDAFQRASIEGSKLHMQESMRDRSELERESRMPGLEKKKLEHTFADRQKMMEQETLHRNSIRAADEEEKLKRTFADRLNMMKEEAAHRNSIRAADEEEKLKRTFADRLNMMKEEIAHRTALRQADKQWDAANAAKIEAEKLKARIPHEKELHQLRLGGYYDKSKDKRP